MDLELPPRLTPGDIAPDFSLLDQTGNDISSFAYHGKLTIIYFYPRALTPGCTTEACDFQENLSVLKTLDVDVLGISPDPVKSLAKFTEQHALTFPLLSDENLDTIKAYGAWGEKNNYGKKTEGLIRSTFLINQNWRIQQAAYNVKATGHVAKIIRDWLEKHN